MSLASKNILRRGARDAGIRYILYVKFCHSKSAYISMSLSDMRATVPSLDVQMRMSSRAICESTLERRSTESAKTVHEPCNSNRLSSEVDHDSTVQRVLGRPHTNYSILVTCYDQITFGPGNNLEDRKWRVQSIGGKLICRWASLCQYFLQCLFTDCSSTCYSASSSKEGSLSAVYKVAAS